VTIASSDKCVPLPGYELFANVVFVWRSYIYGLEPCFEPLVKTAVSNGLLCMSAVMLGLLCYHSL